MSVAPRDVVVECGNQGRDRRSRGGPSGGDPDNVAQRQRKLVRPRLRRHRHRHEALVGTDRMLEFVQARLGRQPVWGEYKDHRLRSVDPGSRAHATLTRTGSSHGRSTPPCRPLGAGRRWRPRPHGLPARRTRTHLARPPPRSGGDQPRSMRRAERQRLGEVDHGACASAPGAPPADAATPQVPVYRSPRHHNPGSHPAAPAAVCKPTARRFLNA
jgi:hypothetical protein